MFAKREVLAAVSALLALAAYPATASTRMLKPRPGEAKHLGPVLAPFKAPGKASGTWTPLAVHFPGSGPSLPLQMTDGTVIVHDACTPTWYRLTPDASGDYVNGTWKKLPAMPKKYDPLYFASQVLADGRVVVNGGEYSNGCTDTWTNKGAIYDPVTNSWTAVAAPKNVKNIGDAQSVVLPDGGYMLANAITSQEIIGTFDPAGSPTWNSTGAGKKDRNDEEGWTFIPFGQILTVDATRGLGGSVNKTELYDIATGTWSDGPDTPNALVDPHSSEIGPAVLIPGGGVFQVGGTPCDSNCPGHTATYSPLTNTWAAGPDIPKVSTDYGDSSDGPSVLLPNGNVLIQTSPIFASPSHFFEYNGVKLTRVSEPTDAPNVSSYEGRMMSLPTGQVLWTSDLGDIEVYTTTYKANPNWAPTIAKSPKKLVRGQANYRVTGTRFNGMTQGNGYGDDAQSFTNYPLVRITNKATGHVCFARTHDHSTMGVNEAGDPTSTNFDVPASCEVGASTLQVIANGMASPAVHANVS